MNDLDIKDMRECLQKIEEALSELYGKKIHIVVFDPSEKNEIRIEYVDQGD